MRYFGGENPQWIVVARRLFPIRRGICSANCLRQYFSRRRRHRGAQQIAGRSRSHVCILWHAAAMFTDAVSYVEDHKRNNGRKKNTWLFYSHISSIFMWQHVRFPGTNTKTNWINFRITSALSDFKYTVIQFSPLWVSQFSSSNLIQNHYAQEGRINCGLEEHLLQAQLSKELRHF